jgi:hypothetical protein
VVRAVRVAVDPLGGELSVDPILDAADRTTRSATGHGFAEGHRIGHIAAVAHPGTEAHPGQPRYRPATDLAPPLRHRSLQLVTGTSAET